MADAPISRAATSHIARLDRTLKDLQKQVAEREAALANLRASSKPISSYDEPSEDPATQLLQIRQLTAAYESLTPEEPVLPAPDSPLPSLLALRGTHATVLETREELHEAKKDLGVLEQRLKKEEADLDDANLIQSTVKARISVLETTIEEKSQKPSAQVAKDMISKLKAKKTKYDNGTGRLVQEFNRFVDEHLAAMLAAEELGGPVVGEMLDVDEEGLEAGFDVRGRVRKGRDAQGGEKRQRRIDEIWGQRREREGVERGQWNEKAAAAGEMRELTEKLLNRLMEASAGQGDGFIELDRESAAARFLVRSKVAQFHPRDARKLRLIDFGRDLDD